MDRGRSSQVRWAFWSGVSGGLGFRESGRTSWASAVRQCSGSRGNRKCAHLLATGEHGGLRTCTLPRPALLKARLGEAEGS